MSFCIDFLRFILCCYVGEDDEYVYRNRNSLSQREVVPDYSTFSRSYSPPPTISTPFISHSGAQPASNVHVKYSSNSWKLPEKSLKNSPVLTPEIRTKTSIPTKLPQKLNDSSVKPNAVTDSAIQYKSTTVSKLENSREFSEAVSTSSKLLTSSSKPLFSSSTMPAPSLSSSSLRTPPSSLKPHQPSSKPTLSLAPSTTDRKLENSREFSEAVSSSSKLLTSSSKPLFSSSMPPASSPKPAPSLSSSSLRTPPSSLKPLQPSSKPTLSLAPSNSTSPRAKTNYVLVQKDKLLIYAIPEDLKKLFKREDVPRVLKKPVTPSTYKDYFEALLYAEDFYIEKWDGFEIKNVTLELHEAAIYKRRGDVKSWNVNGEKDDKVFVAFKIDSIPERRPFLLSRDFVSLRPLGNEAKSFQGLIYRVVKSNQVLVEFEENFHRQHFPSCKYDVKFSFNRVCLKRAHQAILAASDLLFQNFLFPDHITEYSPAAVHPQIFNPKLDWDQLTAVRQILNHTNSSPYVVEGTLSVKMATRCSSTGDNIYERVLSRTGEVIREVILNIYRNYPSCHILICAPINTTCDVITRSLQEEIPDTFRANAAFREVDGVPFEIFPNCRYKEECFSCPPLLELRQFKVIVSTFMSGFRLHNEGITAGHFSHIFLVDASSATEPEIMVALANLANERTEVIVTGSLGNRSGWVRSNIARKNGLMTSYFERLRQRKLYKSLDSRVITRVSGSG